jgi:DeoR family transcriptional regulator, fructose operon transcriptional repressor
VAIAGTLTAEQRRAALRAGLAEQGQLRLAEVAAEWDVHPMTIRRDFEQLEREGVARRVRGGLLHVTDDVFDRRQARGLTAKRKIAAKLRDLVPSDAAVGMDASTTVHLLAAGMPVVQSLSVVTNGLAAFESLHASPGVRTFFTGGEREERNNSLVGPIAVATIRQFLLARCFLSAAALNPLAGTSETTIEQAAVKQAMAEVSDYVVLAVDASKLGHRSLVRSIGLDRVDLLVTDLAPDDARLDDYRDLVELR